jgi:branched-chain amino acid transport system ATP-binding protein
MLLEIKDLRVNYEKAEALKGFSLKMDEGESLAIVGANGAGKTTILRTISGLQKPASGEVWFQGKRIDGMPAHEIIKRGIVHVPAGRMLFAPMTVWENLKIGAYVRKDKQNIKRDIDTMYEHFPILKERETQLAGSLSGGEQQMLAIACALMARPKLLLMDEPSTGLSPLLVSEVGNIIGNIHQGGVSIILVEQNTRLAFKLAQRGYILEVGSVVLEGSTEELANSELVKKAYLGG